MHEIEVKAVLKDKEAFIAALARLGCEFGPEIKQEDTVYVREVGSIETYLSNSAFLRLRVQNDGRTLFTYKHHPARIVTLDSAPLELELEVSSREVMEKILLIMGYKEAVRIAKHRRKTTYKNWEVCVDDVEGLGSYVEMEELAETTDDVPEIKERMQAFLAEQGVGEGDILRNRYDVMMLEKE
jgi:adenylate cyclase class 2